MLNSQVFTLFSVTFRVVPFWGTKMIFKVQFQMKQLCWDKIMELAYLKDVHLCVCQWPWRLEFNPMLSHSKDSKNSTSYLLA